MAFIFDQEVSRGSEWEDFATSIDAIEAVSGLDFLSDLPDGVEGRLESRGGAVW